MKRYFYHYCERQHRTGRTMAKCLWPRARWIAGHGRYAVLAHCKVLTVELHETANEAEAAKRLIDNDACGGRCTNKHEIIAMPGVDA